MGVPESVLLIEDRSTNTKENAAFSKQLLSEHKIAPPYLLITSSMHMPRADLLFRQVGINADPYTCNYVSPTNDPGFGFFVPQPEVLGRWSDYFKEVFGYAWYKWKGN